jgi:hydroxymethylbilane synthase
MTTSREYPYNSPGNIDLKMTTLRIGSRPSALALAQTELVRHQLAALVPSVAIEIVPIRTSGDKIVSASLAQVGGKGLFIKELEQALTERRIDLAVHSMKDLPATLTSGLRIAAIPKRADPRDALLTRTGAVETNAGDGLAALAHGARLGTSSSRRRFEALRIRSDLSVNALRGNVDTRISRLEAGDFDAIILAMAGLARLGGANPAGVDITPLDERDFVPAGGQGALAIETLADEPLGGSPELDTALAALDDNRARLEVSAERGFLAALGASCVSPVGAHAALRSNTLNVRALLFSLDGTRNMADEISEAIGPDAPIEHAIELGTRMARRMLAGGGREMLSDG